ncbi:MAG: hypothetical protein HDR10_13205 [Lachnospiraceae bacterium]|nr:hypothetical protein [Lachnospiraceae bacterium]MBD5502129.1 hypothetical protein [Lachnospiraceae bacterium]
MKEKAIISATSFFVSGYINRRGYARINSADRFPVMCRKEQKENEKKDREYHSGNIGGQYFI